MGKDPAHYVRRGFTSPLVLPMARPAMQTAFTWSLQIVLLG